MPKGYYRGHEEEIVLACSSCLGRGFVGGLYATRTNAFPNSYLHIDGGTYPNFNCDACPNHHFLAIANAQSDSNADISCYRNANSYAYSHAPGPG